MKIVRHISLLFLLAGLLNAQVFFSEYIEGSSNNKALEIYNAGSTTVDLTQYNILTNANGSAWSGMYSFADGATLAPGEVYVIANSSASQTILDQADEMYAYNEVGYLTSFNGDDVRALVQISGTDTTIIDIIGAYDLVDPGTAWDVAGVTGGTVNHTLVRKSSVTSGNSDWSSSAGTNADDSEWIVYDQDTFDYLGSHTMDGGTENPFTAIADIQTTADGLDGDSPMTGDSVMVQGIVTAVRSSGYFLQDAASAWSGIYVYDSGNAPSMAVGNQISFSADVAEYNGLTELTNVADFTLIATDVALPAPLEVATGELNKEMYESVLVTTFGVCDSIGGGSEWALNDGSGKIIVDDYLYSYAPTLGGYYSVTGPMNYYSTYKIAIRNADDVSVTSYLSISEIQQTEDISGDSPYAGDTVVTSGTVTAATSSSYFIQSGEGAWSGVYVYGSNDVAVGDSLLLVARVTEYYNLTELVPQKTFLLGSDMELPAPVSLTLDAINDEMYEGVLVTTVGECTVTDLGSGEWQLGTAPDSIVVDEQLLDVDFTPVSGVDYSVTGPLNYTYSKFKIAPRDTTLDIVALAETPKAEPSAYPTEFAAAAEGTSITVTWTDATGDVLPDGYVIGAYTASSLEGPVDGEVITEDLNLSDGEGAVHVAYGVETYTFSGLEEDTEYNFVIYPYTNASVQSDYKTDGTVPTTNATTGKAAVVILSEDFESDAGDMTTYDVVGTQSWGVSIGTGYGADGTSGYMLMNGYSSTEKDEDWLISPAIDFSLYTNESLSFYSESRYALSTEVKLYYSENYDGVSAPSTATWTELSFTQPEVLGAWIQSTVDLSTFEGSNVYFAFKYSEEDAVGAWGIDEIVLTGIPAELVDLKPSVNSVTRDITVPTTSESVVISAEVTDDNEVSSVTLYYEIDGTPSTVAMENTEGDMYEGTIPAAYSDGSMVEYAVIATDNAAQSDTSSSSVFLAGTSHITTAKTPNENAYPEYYGVYMRVTGVATGIFGTTRTEFYVQEDSTAGVMIFATGFTADITVGNSYTIVGKMSFYAGLMEIVPDSAGAITDNGAAEMPEPMMLTIPEILAGAEDYEGMLLEIESVSRANVDNVAWSFSGSGVNFNFNAGEDTIAVRIDADTDIFGADEPEWPANMIGILGQYDSSSPYTTGYQFYPRSLDDFGEPTDVDDENDALVTEYSLSQNYPNPFNPSTKIKFSIKEAGMVTVKIYNILGQEVATLVHEQMNVGSHEINFNASKFSSGVYLYNIQAGDFRQTKKMILLK